MEEEEIENRSRPTACKQFVSSSLSVTKGLMGSRGFKAGVLCQCCFAPTSLPGSPPLVRPSSLPPGALSKPRSSGLALVEGSHTPIGKSCCWFSLRASKKQVQYLTKRSIVFLELIRSSAIGESIYFLLKWHPHRLEETHQLLASSYLPGHCAVLLFFFPDTWILDRDDFSPCHPPRSL